MQVAEILTEAIKSRRIYELAYQTIEKVFREVATNSTYHGEDYRSELRWMLRDRLQGLTDALYGENKIAGIHRLPVIVYPAEMARRDNLDGTTTTTRGGLQIHTANSADLRLYLPSLPAPEYLMAFTAAFIRGRDGGEYKSDIHALARTYTHEFVHAIQMARINPKTVRRDPDDVVQMQAVVRASHRRELSKWDRGTADFFNPEDSWYDPRLKIPQGNYMSEFAEIEAHAINAAHDLVHHGSPAEAKKVLAQCLKNPGWMPDDWSLQQAYRNLRKNPYIDTEKAWRRFLKKVYQHIDEIDAHEKAKAVSPDSR